LKGEIYTAADRIRLYDPYKEYNDFLNLLTGAGLVGEYSLEIYETKFYISNSLRDGSKFVFFTRESLWKEYKLGEVWDQLPLKFKEIAVFNMDLFA
jgi:hypothetical protein